MNIYSPIATGSGAYVVHKILADKITNYHLCGYNPYWALFPPALPFVCSGISFPDIIHTTPDYAWWFRKEKSVPLIITFHNYVLDPFMEQYSSLLQRIHYKTDLRFFTLKAIQSAEVVTSVSRFTAKKVCNEMKFKGNIEVIYNGVDTRIFRPSKNQIHKKKIKVLFSGNITRRKGADLIPQIAHLLESGIEILCTSGLRAQKKIKRFGGKSNIRNIGSIPYSEMPKLYQQADILLFPTVREGLPLAVLEAMACGLPVVTTNCSSLPELIIDGKGGYLCEIGDIEAFSARINQLAASPKLRHEMGEFNRARVEKNFTIDRMINRYRDLFEKVCGKKLFENIRW